MAGADSGRSGSAPSCHRRSHPNLRARKSKTPIRTPLTSPSFRAGFRTKNYSFSCYGTRAKGFSGGPQVSLSEFLNRKLQKPSLPAGTVQCQLRPFSMLLESRDHLLPGDVKGGDKNGVRGEKEDIDKGIFQQFKLSVKEKDNCASSCSLDEGGSFQLEEEVQESRKRRNPFQGENISGKHIVVLGKGQESKQRGSRDSFITNKKPRAEFNHYENGGGFWDSNMLGIDNEEVGFSEVWEGVGSTTLGGIEWH